ncbi:MAG: hypothetical protein FWD85_09100 [Microbacteriaceae bacterium]|nr:hypothetical protein [Microbacteriaceae bacterium]MCL2795448.1 hypothetical protein [Microbacteriaceae bacterium]
MSESKSVTARLSAAMPRLVGTGTLTVLVAVYLVLVMAAVGRSAFQIIDHFSKAPIAISISGVSAVVYLLATAALIIHKGAWYRVAWVTVSIEFAGVIVVGAITTFWPNALGPDSGNAFGDTATVWTVFGQGYWFVPLVLPLAGMLWLRKHPAGIRAKAAR